MAWDKHLIYDMRKLTWHSYQQDFYQWGWSMCVLIPWWGLMNHIMFVCWWHTDLRSKPWHDQQGQVFLVPNFWYERSRWGRCYSKYQVDQGKELDYSDTFSLGGENLSRFGYKYSKLSPTPYYPSLILWKNKRSDRDQLRYSYIIGYIMYLIGATRSNISFVVSKLSWFTSNLGDNHWHTLELVMHYLVSTMEYAFYYPGYPAVLEG
jgi:hypothetical protein